MSFYWIKTNAIIKRIFSNYIWEIPNSNNNIYLTFDDGPTPEITEWVLDELDKHSAKATFFCIGKNIVAQPALFKKIIDKGHAIGNHTFNHLNGWKTTTKDYLNNIVLCEQSIINHKINSKIFRPPYGRINSIQSKKLRKQGYKIIMWDVLSADFDQSITNEKCVKNVVVNIKPGSIIVFHDSHKAFNNLKYALPKVLDFIDKNNFNYEIIQ